MAAPDGSMTFDWIFYTIVFLPMLWAAWELYKTNKGIAERRRSGESSRPATGPVPRPARPSGR